MDASGETSISVEASGRTSWNSSCGIQILYIKALDLFDTGFYSLLPFIE